MNWPSGNDYREAVQNPHICFTHPDLKQGRFAIDPIGLPKLAGGQFAVAFEAATPSGRWAIRCFTLGYQDQQERYHHISSHLRSARLPYTAAFEYLANGIRVNGQERPIIKMEWVSGVPLNTYIQQNLNNRQALHALAQNWRQMVNDLRAANVAHGDLQHGNVLVTSNGQLKLVDYDGMWVPALAGKGSHEVGHPNYQNPRRTEQDFTADTDAFSGTVIWVAICALTHRPDLWSKYDNGDNLLFVRKDFTDLASSSLVRDLHALGDPEVSKALSQVLAACPRRVPIMCTRTRQVAKTVMKDEPVYTTKREGLGCSFFICLVVVIGCFCIPKAGPILGVMALLVSGVVLGVVCGKKPTQVQTGTKKGSSTEYMTEEYEEIVGYRDEVAVAANIPSSNPASSWAPIAPKSRRPASSSPAAAPDEWWKTH